MRKPGQTSVLSGAMVVLLTGCSPSENPDTGQDTGNVDSSLPANYGTQAEHCSDPSVIVEAGSMWEVTGEHYALSVGSSWTESEAETFGRLIESAWPALADYFRTEAQAPDGGLLEVFFFDTETEWATAIELDGLTVPWGAGGLFHSSTGRAYLWRQPERYTNRMLLMHEVAHQYHQLSVQTQATASWFHEGVAGYLERHDWYEDCIRLGVVPTGTLEDFHGTALANWESGALDLESFVAGDGFSRPDSTTLWAYLEESHPDAFEDFRDAVDSGSSIETDAFADILGAPGDHAETYEDWLRSHQEPIEVIYTGWRHIDQEHIEADIAGTGTLVFAPLKDTPSSFSTTIHPRSTTYSAGVLTSFEDWNHWSVVVGESDGSVYALHYGDDGGLWETLAPYEASDVLQISYQVTDQTTELILNGASQSYTHDHLGAAGLGVYDSKVVFEIASE